MVTKQEDTSQQNLQDGDGGLPEFNIQDSTPSEQLEIEAELDSELEQSPEQQEQATEQTTEQVETGAEQGVQPESQPGASEEPSTQVETPEQPQTRTYSDEEVRKIQAAKDAEVARANAELQQLREAEAQRRIEQSTESALVDQEAQLASSIGAEEARRLVRTRQNVAAVKQGQEAIQRAGQLQQQNAEILQQQEVFAKQTVAQQMVNQYGLQAEDLDLLTGTANPAAMQNLAKRLSTYTLQQRKDQQAQRQRVPAETQDTQLTNGHSTGAASETPEQALKRISAMPGYEWSEADAKFMRDGPPGGWS